MIYTKEWAFIHIPKTSGINLKSILIKNKDVMSPFNYENDMFKDWTQLERNMQHNPYWWWQDSGVLTTQKAFSIVRNPYTRAASFYTYVTSLHPNIPATLESFYTEEWRRNAGFNFELEEIQWDYQTTQVDFVTPSDNKNYPKIYKYETELDKLQEYLNIDINSSRLNTQPSIDYKKFYNDRSRVELVNSLFKEDFIAFDYEMMEP